MKTHRTVFALEIAFLDAHTCAMVDEAFEAFLDKVERPSRILLDFGPVDYISSSIGLFLRATDPKFKHKLVCLRPGRNVRDIFAVLGLDNLPQIILQPDGVCPLCAGKDKFDNVRFQCQKCGPLEVSRIRLEEDDNGGRPR
ncbi:MAG: STAS domain-containing protein [Planctomycetes bacterium]|nr:STAS domain-containing protein [Planctomycetota bacterium]